jgi:hypothetical protein
MGQAAAMADQLLSSFLADGASVLDVLPGLKAEDIPSLLSAAAEGAGLGSVGLYLADLQEQVLVAWTGGDRSAELSIDGSLAGRAFRRMEPIKGEGGVWWFPLTDGSQRLGVMSLGSADDDDAIGQAGLRLARLAGLLIVSRLGYCDSLVTARRTQPLSMAAELRWALMPPRVMTTHSVTVAGVLEPAYDIAGDSFDYALNGDRLHLAVFDAMGHGLTASRLANLAVASYRHSRRAGLSLLATYREMDTLINEVFGDGVFVTGHLAELDVPTGRLTVLNAGHPRPLLIRGGSAHELAFEPASPVGMGLVEAEAGEVRLEPGDAVLILSDGVSEARSAGGDIFGADRVGDLAVRTLAGGETIPETTRRLILSLMEHRGLALEDDATLLLFCWHPKPEPSDGPS